MAEKIRRVKQFIVPGITGLVVFGLVGYHLFSWIQVPNFLHSIGNTGTITQNKALQEKNAQVANVAGKAGIMLAPPTRIIMPRIGLDKSVIISNQISTTEWNISKTAANFADGTTFPNSISGNTVIFGHDTTAVFHSIHNLHVGDIVDVYTTSQVYTYTITKTAVVSPYDVGIMDPSDKPTLTLFTCDGWFSQNRFAAFAAFTAVKNLS